MFPARVCLPLFVFAFAGCASSGNLIMVVPTAGGERVRVPFSRGGVVPSENDDVRIDAAGFTTNVEKRQLAYAFTVTVKRGAGLKRVRVEDVSGTTPELLVDDPAPVLRDQRWHGANAPLSASDERLKWLYTIDNSVRVFRFTITTADGRELVLHQGSPFPAGMKAAVRQSFGENY